MSGTTVGEYILNATMNVMVPGVSTTLNRRLKGRCSISRERMKMYIYVMCP